MDRGWTMDNVTLPLSAYGPDGNIAVNGTVGYAHPDHGRLCGKCLRERDLYAGSDGVIALRAWMAGRASRDADPVTCDGCGGRFLPERE